MPLYSRKIMSKISCEDDTNINTELGKYSLFKVVAFFIKFVIMNVWKHFADKELIKWFYI